MSSPSDQQDKLATIFPLESFNLQTNPFFNGDEPRWYLLLFRFRHVAPQLLQYKSVLPEKWDLSFFIFSLEVSKIGELK